MRRTAIERDRFDAAMRGEQDGAARRLVHAARLHADEAVLDQVEPADAVLATERVEPRQQLAGDIVSPSTATASPRSKSIVTWRLVRRIFGIVGRE